MVGVLPFDEAELRDRDVARLELELFLVAGEIVGAGAVDLERREARRHLADLAGEARQHRLDRSRRRPRVALATIAPSASSVSVSAPEAHGEAVGLAPSTTNGTVLVASPSAIGSTPVASGSSVPACPALPPIEKMLTLVTALVEVMPCGLSRMSQPLTAKPLRCRAM